MLYRASVRIKQAHAVERDCGASRLLGACWAPPGGVSELVVSSQEEALVSQSVVPGQKTECVWPCLNWRRSSWGQCLGNWSPSRTA